MTHSGKMGTVGEGATLNSGAAGSDLWGPAARERARLEAAAMRCLASKRLAPAPVKLHRNERAAPDGGILRRCYLCKDWKDVESFKVDKRAPRGRCFLCRECAAARKNAAKGRAL